MKLHYLLLKKFNNYFNRKIIRYETLEDYENNSEDYFTPTNTDSSYTEFDFNPNDNVTTETIINDLPFTPDYLVLFDDDENIDSRWFVVEVKRLRNGSWTYYLKRDVISDNLPSLLTSPIFVHKGKLSEASPFIVNDEGMSFNQIKVSEELLKDKSGTAWIVGYLAKSASANSVTVQGESGYDPVHITANDIATDLGVTEAEITSLFDSQTHFVNKLKINYIDFAMGITDYRVKIISDAKINNVTPEGKIVFFPETTLFKNPTNAIGGANLFISEMQARAASFPAFVEGINGRKYWTSDDLTKLSAYQGQIIEYLGNFFRINISTDGISNETLDSDFANTKYALLKTIADVVAASPNYSYATNPKFESLELESSLVTIKLEELSSGDTVDTLTTKISSSRRVTKKQEFDMFAMPLDQSICGGTITEDNVREIAAAIALELDANIYDIQLLPYSPISDDYVDLNELTEGKDFDYIKSTMGRDSDSIPLSYFLPVGYHGSGGDFTYTYTADLHGGTQVLSAVAGYRRTIGPKGSITNVSISGANIIITLHLPAGYPVAGIIGVKYTYDVASNVGALFYCENAEFKTFISKPLSSALGLKVLSQVELYRLVSPNYQGSFDFNLAKNGGKLSGFNVYCTYKPYTPFIKVTPQFEWLYGADFNDNRGLICGGDYSLPRAKSAWETYQLENKNYQNIFNREIQSMDFNYTIDKRIAVISGISSIVGDAAKGALSGGMLSGGNPVGALIGGAVGGVTSAIGMQADIENMTAKYHEARQLSIDKYNYQLGNIKALPYTLTKVGNFNNSSKIFPFLERYTATDEEIQALNLKLKYDGMTVMKIGYLADFASFDPYNLNYFKGELIRCDEIADDYHALEAIYAELLKGVYI